MKLKLKNNKILKGAVLFILAVLLGFVLATNQAQEGGREGSLQNKAKIEISGVRVNDFVKDSNLEEESFITIDKTKDYHVFYIPNQELFYISITSFPFEEHIVSAENALLKALGITQEDVCQLNVDVTTPSFANPEYAGKVYGLSFCSP